MHNVAEHATAWGSPLKEGPQLPDPTSILCVLVQPKAESCPAAVQGTCTARRLNLRLQSKPQLRRRLHFSAEVKPALASLWRKMHGKAASRPAPCARARSGSAAGFGPRRRPDRQATRGGQATHDIRPHAAAVTRQTGATGPLFAWMFLCSFVSRGGKRRRKGTAKECERERK